MDPLTAALNAYVATLNAWATWFGAASPAQQQQIIQMHLDGQAFWHGLFEKLVALTPKGKKDPSNG